ncbi:MAG: hypothetical protein H0T52_03895 [Lautropia sp.]|nr:hypothetical protein [Lautropia sp.]
MSSSSQGIDVNQMALAGLGQVMDSMDLVKRAWSNFSLATPFTPTLDVAEIDKRIRDLRAVEQWLSLNQTMLRSTIQGLEIQRGTLNAFNSVSESFGPAAKPADGALAQTFARFAAAAAQKSVTAPGAVEPAGTAAPAGMPAAGFDWSPLAMPSSLPFSWPAAAAPSEDDAGATKTGGQQAATHARVAGAAAHSPAGAAAETASAGEQQLAAKGAGIDPLGWWQMLQENFRQIAQAATGQTAASADAGTPMSPRTPTPGGTRKSAGGGKAGGAGKARKPRRGKKGNAREQE